MLLNTQESQREQTASWNRPVPFLVTHRRAKIDPLPRKFALRKWTCLASATPPSTTCSAHLHPCRMLHWISSWTTTITRQLWRRRPFPPCSIPPSRLPQKFPPGWGDSCLLVSLHRKTHSIFLYQRYQAGAWNRKNQDATVSLTVFHLPQLMRKGQGHFTTPIPQGRSLRQCPVSRPTVQMWECRWRAAVARDRKTISSAAPRSPSDISVHSDSGCTYQQMSSSGLDNSNESISTLLAMGRLYKCDHCELLFFRVCDVPNSLQASREGKGRSLRMSSVQRELPRQNVFRVAYSWALALECFNKDRSSESSHNNVFDRVRYSGQLIADRVRYSGYLIANGNRVVHKYGLRVNVSIC